MKKLLLLIILMFIITSCDTPTTNPNSDNNSNKKKDIVEFTIAKDSAPLFHFTTQTTENIIYTVIPNGKAIKSFTITGIDKKLQILSNKEESNPVTELVVEAKDSDDYIASSKQLKFKLTLTKYATDNKESIDYTILTTFDDNTTKTTTLQFEVIKHPTIAFNSGAGIDSIALSDGSKISGYTDMIDTDEKTCQTIITIDETKFFTETGSEPGENAVDNYTLDKIIITSTDGVKLEVSSDTVEAPSHTISDDKNELTASIDEESDDKTITDYTRADGVFKFKLKDGSDPVDYVSVTPSIHLTYIDPKTKKSINLIVKGNPTKVSIAPYEESENEITEVESDDGIQADNDGSNEGSSSLDGSESSSNNL